jgi:hypothetical protein
MSNCAKRDCLTRAKRGAIFCSVHEGDIAGAAVMGENLRGRGLTALYTEDEQNALTAFGSIGDLSGEIEALRVLLLRNFREDNREQVIATVNALVRAEVARHRLSGKQAAGLLKAIDAVLAELGVGESQG